jgi:hypothetical protein
MSAFNDAQRWTRRMAAPAAEDPDPLLESRKVPPTAREGIRSRLQLRRTSM